MFEVSGYNAVARLYGCGDSSWDDRMKHLIDGILHEGGFEADLKTVKAGFVVDCIIRDFHLIVATRNITGSDKRFCYVVEFDMLGKVSFSLLSGAIAISVVSVIVSHYFDNRDIGYMAESIMKAAMDDFPDAKISNLNQK